MRRRTVKPRFYVFLCLLIAVFFGITFAVSWSRLSKENEALDATVERRDDLRGDVYALESELDYAQTDDYVERSARDRLGMLFPGEYRYVAN